MHVYSINSNKREEVIRIITIIDLILSSWLEYQGIIDNISNWMMINILNISSDNYIYHLVLSGVHAIVPVGIYGISFGLYNKFIWKWKVLYRWHHIPNLNGKWQGTVESPLKEKSSDITADIKQTWTKIQVQTRAVSGAHSESGMIEVVSNDEKSDTFFRYSFRTERGNEKYIGYNKLQYTGSKLEGEYFTNKKLSDKQCDEGKGSKGVILLKRILKNEQSR